MSSHREITIRALTPADVEAYRAIRLEGLRLVPDAFSSSFEEESALPLEAIAARLERGSGMTFGAFGEGEAMLAGTAGCYREDRLKTRHKLLLVGMYVRPAYRGRGLGERLIERVLQHAREMGGIKVVQLGVGCDNHAARALYERMGFSVYGVERKAMKACDRYIDEELRDIEI